MVEAMTDVARMEDDGGCLTQGVGLRIGIPPTPQPAAGNAGSKLDPEGGPPDSAAPVAAETPDDGKLTWAKYSAWRKTKCPNRGEAQRMLDLDQATLELVGETGEVGSIVGLEGLAAFRGTRTKLIDEIGGVIFCAAWAISAWGHEDQLVAMDLEMEQRFGPPGADVVCISAITQNMPDENLSECLGIVMEVSAYITTASLQASSMAALTANALKKILYHKREQDSAEQFGRLLYVLGAMRVLLKIAGSNIETAMRTNMQKLDARFPNGWVPGGGNR